MRHAPRILPLVVALAACGGADETAVAVDALGYTEDELLGLGPERRETLAYLAAFGLAVADSATAELGRPFVERRVDDRRLEILGAELALERHGVDDAVLEGRYLTDPEWELTVRHILFFSERWRSPQHRAEAQAKAGRALEQLRGGADFATTAARLSEEPGAEGRQGLLQPGREGSWVPEFWAAALALEPGEISPITETQYGYHILRLEDREVVPFAEARSVVAREVARQVDDPARVLEAWLDGAASADAADPAARRAAALEEAARRGLEVPAAERTAIEREWENLTYRWALGLGFQYGMSDEQVRQAALAALARPGQNAQIARSEIVAHADLFRRVYDIRTAPAGG